MITSFPLNVCPLLSGAGVPGCAQKSVNEKCRRRLFSCCYNLEHLPHGSRPGQAHVGLLILQRELQCFGLDDNYANFT